jgi:hypothetical protein
MWDPLVEVKLGLCVDVVLLNITNAGKASQVWGVKDLEMLLEDLDDLIPDSEDGDDCSQWTRVRQEYTAYLHLCIALEKLNQLKEYGITGSQLMQGRVQGLVRGCIDALRVAVGYRPVVAGVYQLGDFSRTPAMKRLSLGARLVLAIVGCFHAKWVLADNVERTGGEGDVFPLRPPEKGYDALRLDSPFPLWRFRKADWEFEGVPKDVGQVLKWIGSLTDSTAVVGGISGVAAGNSLESVDSRYLLTDPWDLSSAVRVLAGYVQGSQGGKVREWLRRVFSRLPEKPTKYPTATERPPARTPTLTVADMEAFIMMLVTNRCVELMAKFNARTVGQVIYLAELGLWEPTENQKRFWWHALVNFGQVSLLDTSIKLKSS